jgi:hypothetical protein
MRNLFAISGLLVIALTAACDGASSHPKATTDGGLSDGAAGAGKDTAGDAGTLDLSGAAGAGGAGGRTVVGAGGSGGAAAATTIATGGGEGSDGPPAKGGSSSTDGPAATGGTGGAGSAGTTGSAVTPSSAGTTSAAGTSGTAGRTATAGTSGSAGASGSAGRTATAGTSGSAGRTSTAGTSGSAGTSGGGSTGIATPADNVVAAVVDFGLPNIGYVNGLFVSVTVCVPGTTQCQTIDHVLVDTGSTGLRLLKSALTLSLPAWTNSSGVTLAECTQFVSGFTWGPLRSADLTIAGEQANGLAVQVIGETTYPVPSACTGTNTSNADTLRANGIIGVGSFLQDCGPACATTPGSRSSNPGVYYACSSSAKGGCVAAAVPTAKQITNPVALFSQDNNGTIIQLPTVPANGAASVTGALIFGIGTRDNNGLGQATVLPIDNGGRFLTAYPANGNTTFAFIDSGSNALYFANAGSTRIPTCTTAKGFYCPRSTLNLSATNQDATGAVSATVNFSIANAETLLARGNNVAYYNLGGTSAMGGYFDWGLPFYFGKSVYASIEGQSTPVGTGLFVAF